VKTQRRIVASSRIAAAVGLVPALVAALLGVPRLAIPAVAAGDVNCDRPAAIRAWQSGGSAVRAAAETALVGTDDQLCGFVDTTWPQQITVDERASVERIMAGGGPATRTAAAAALTAGTTQAVRDFLSSGWRTPWQTDQRVRVNQMMAAGGPRLRQAGQAVLDGGLPDALATFLDDGWRAPWALDQRIRVNQLLAAGGAEVKAAAQRALDDGSAAALTQFIDVEWPVATAHDQETATITDLLNAATVAGEQAKSETVAAQEAADRAVAATELAKQAAQRAALAAANAQNDAAAAAAAARQAAAAADNAARAARDAVSAAQSAAHAARVATDAAAKAAWAASMAGNAAARAYRSAADAATNAGAAASARQAAQAARDIAVKAKDTATKADQAGKAAEAAARASQSAAAAGQNAADAATAAADAASHAGAAAAEAAKARAAAARARADAARATRAAQSAGTFAAAAARAAYASRDAANRAVADAIAAADAADEAADHAGDAANAAAEATQHADDASTAAQAALDAADQAKAVYDVARAADADRIAIAAEQESELAQDAVEAQTAARQQIVIDARQAAQRNAETNRLIAEAAAPATPAATAVADARKVALVLATAGGGWTRQAAVQALGGDDAEALAYVRTGIAVAAGQDDRVSVAALAKSDNAKLADAAKAALAGTDADVTAFLGSQNYPGRLTDDRVKVNQVLSAARTSGQVTVAARAQTALDAGDDQTLRTFLANGQYDALAVDERVRANQLIASPDSGPELKAAAQVALDNTPTALHGFLTTGRYVAAQHDQDAAAHDAVVTALLGQIYRIASDAVADAQNAQAAAATARGKAAEAAGYAQQARDSAQQAANYAQQAQTAATQAEAAAARAAQSAATARNAAQQANASASTASAAASAAQISAQRAAQSAAAAYDSYTQAYASAVAAGKDRDAALAAASDAINNYIQARKADNQQNIDLATGDCADRYGRGTREVALCVYLITHPVDDTAKELYLEVKNGPMCDRLHPTLPHIPPIPNQAWLDCVHNGPGDGLAVKILEYATPFLTLAGAGIQAVADKLHVDPSVAAILLGAGLAFTLAALPELTVICAELCTLGAAALDTLGPMLVPDLLPLTLDQALLTLYGMGGSAILVEGAGTTAAGLGAIRIAGFIEREMVEAEATEARLAQLMRSIKDCVGNSFSPDTPVLLADGGSEPISDVRVGDRVATADPGHGPGGAEPVTRLHRDVDTDLVDVTVVNGQDGASTIHTTQHHPFWDETTGRWTDAVDLRRGERLRTADGSVRAVGTVRAFTGSREMFNLTVAGSHTYFVAAGGAGVLVHNVGPSCGALWINPDRLVHHYMSTNDQGEMHAVDFGVNGNYNPANALKFVEAIQHFIASPSDLLIRGTFRGQDAWHYVDPDTGLHVSFAASGPNVGEYLGGWKSSGDQLLYLLTQGKL
jgi:pretoxin HINT domain-containing protein/colicin D/short repeat uncharacterized protein predicted to be involved in signal transduction